MKTRLSNFGKLLLLELVAGTRGMGWLELGWYGEGVVSKSKSYLREILDNTPSPHHPNPAHPIPLEYRCSTKKRTSTIVKAGF